MLSTVMIPCSKAKEALATAEQEPDMLICLIPSVGCMDSSRLSFTEPVLGSCSPHQAVGKAVAVASSYFFSRAFLFQFESFCMQ